MKKWEDMSTARRMWATAVESILHPGKTSVWNDEKGRFERTEPEKTAEASQPEGPRPPNKSV